MNKKIIRKMINTAAIAMSAVIIGTAILDGSSEAVAKSTLPGVEKIISQNTEKNVFTILEIVPDGRMGEIGYYIDGEEPIDWETELLKLSTTKERTDYMDSLYRESDTGPTGILKSITSSTADSDTEATAPLYYQTYQEKYFLTEAEIMSGQWKTADYSTNPMTEMLRGSYVFTEPGENADYTRIVKNAEYELRLDGSGNYKENASYYEKCATTGQGYYNLKFQYTSGGKYVAQGQKLDIINGTPVFINVTSRYIYKLDGEGHFVCVAVKGTDKKVRDVTTNEPFTPASGETYYTVNFKYNASPTTLNTYSIKETEFDYAKNGEYASVLNTNNPYTEVKSGTGNFSIKAGTGTAVEFNYTPGAGNYKWVSDESKEAVSVKLGKLYYQGGFTNQEWFKKFVLDLDPDQYDKFYIDVQTVTPDQLESFEISAADMIYISGSNTTYLPGETADVHYYRSDEDLKNDISWRKAMTVLENIVKKNLPVIIDFSIIEEAQKDAAENVLSGINANIYKMTSVLLQRDLLSYYNNLVSSGSAPEPVWTDISAEFFSDGNDNYVNKNIYVFSAEDKRLTNTNFADVFGQSEVNDGFEEIMEEINNENFYRANDATNTYEQLSTDISEAVAVKYVINYANKRETIFKNSISILEVEPCASYDLSKDNIRTLLNQQNLTDSQINLVQMTTAEFIGKIEDLNGKYDMIYIGVNTGLMYKDSSGKTVYNDKSMNGLVYSNVGDKVYCMPNIGGMVDTDYVDNNRQNYLLSESYIISPEYHTGTSASINNFLIRKTVDNTGTYGFTEGSTTYTKTVDVNEPGSYRYPGNDITKEKYEDLVEYVTAGYPVVIGDGFFKTDSASGTKILDEDVIDDSSYIYMFANDMTEARKTNVFTYSNLGTTLFTAYLNIPKLKIDLDILPALDENGISHISMSADGLYYMTYDFKILNTAAVSQVSTTYDCNLYVDVNADGKYSRTMEEIGDIEISSGGTKIQPEKTTDGNGLETTVYKLQTGIQYHIRRELPEEYQGVIPWKLEISQSNNYAVRNSVTGYSLLESDNKANIEILQINTSTPDGSWASSNLNLANEMKNTSSNFYKYIKALKNFNINITTVTGTVYASEYAANKEYLDNFDMLILGFADCYSEIDNRTGAVNGILEFIKSGKGVLFTHDTTSFLNVKTDLFQSQDSTGAIKTTYDGKTLLQGQTYWGYNQNTILRDEVGMDRYGVTVNELLKKGMAYAVTTDYESFAEITSSSTKKDIAYEPKSGRTKTCKEVQGYSYEVLNQKKYAIINGTVQQANLYNIDTGSGQYTNPTVTQVNDGQITNYPYKLPSSFSVATTHAQYYQLDLIADDDNDGESDIVVWYCLDGKQDSVSTDTDMYKKSPNDVRNNYFIYNKGNITYSGVGHSKVSSETEAKLFINTMIASYSAGAKAPTVIIKENEDPKSIGTDYIYVPYDNEMSSSPSATGEFLEDEPSVYFYVKDSNFVKGNKSISAKYYRAALSGEEPDKIINGIPVVEILEPKTYNTLTKGIVNQSSLESGGTYEVRIPMKNYLTGVNAVKIFIEVQSQIVSYNTALTEATFDTVDIVMTQLFELE